MLMTSVVPYRRCISCQKRWMNLGSRSVTIMRGGPCNLMIPTTKATSTETAVKDEGRGIKCTYLVGRSTTVIIVVFPLELGRHVMKSIAMSSKTNYETGRG